MKKPENRIKFKLNNSGETNETDVLWKFIIFEISSLFILKKMFDGSFPNVLDGSLGRI